MTMNFESFNAFKIFDFINNPGIEQVTTFGHTVEGVGGAQYTKIGTGGTPNTGDEGKLVTNDGSIWKLTSYPVSVQHFGALEVGTIPTPYFSVKQENTLRINRFLYYIANNNLGLASFAGEYEIDGPLVMDCKNDPSDPLEFQFTRHIVGSPVIRLELPSTPAAGTTYPIKAAFSIFGFGNAVWEGRIYVRLRDSNIWVNRKCVHGTLLSACGRSSFGGFYCRGAAGFGLLCSSDELASGNTSLVDLGDCKFEDCGSGGSSEAQFLSSTWDNKQVVQEVVDGITFTYHAVDVVDIPEDIYLEAARSHPFVLIDGTLHYVRKFFSNNQVALYPRVDDNTDSGSLKWIFGGGIGLRGSDANVVQIGMVDVVRCAVGLDMMSVYGPVVQRVVAQSCFAGMCFGLRHDGAMVSANIVSLYSEGNDTDFIPMVTMARSDGAYHIGAEYALNLDNLLYIKERNPDNSLTHNGLVGYTLHIDGQFASHQKSPKNDGRKFWFILNSKSLSEVYHRDSSEVTLKVHEQLLEPFGYNGGQLTFIGSGTHGSPTGTIKISPYPGYTLNGSTSPLFFDNFSGPAIFSVYYDNSNGNKNFVVGVTNKV